MASSSPLLATEPHLPHHHRKKIPTRGEHVYPVPKPTPPSDAPPHHHHHHVQPAPEPSHLLQSLLFGVVVLLLVTGLVVGLYYIITIFALSSSSSSSSSTPAHTVSLTVPLGTYGRYWVDPNQLASNLWYEPGPLNTFVNGFIANSYGVLSNWPNLRNTLTSLGGAGLSIYAAQVGFTPSAVFLALRAANVSVMTEEPGFTQCISGLEIGDFEILGEDPSIFCNNFLTCPDSLPDGRINPAGNGWWVTSDGYSYAPEEIIFDERMPNLLPIYGNSGDLDLSSPTVVCSQLGGFHPGLDLVSAGIQDYVDFVGVLTTRFPPPHTPRISLNWNVDINWELSEYGCLIYATTADLEHVYDRACHNDTNHMMQLIQTLCNVGTCPTTMFMDVDVIYNSSYALNTVARNKFALFHSGYGVGFGISVEEQCDTYAGQVSAPDNNNNIICATGPNGVTGNALWALGMTNLVTWYVSNGVFDGTTRVRFSSWNDYPVEIGSQTAETVTSSMASTYNLILSEILIPNLVNNPGFTLVNSVSAQPAGYFSLVPAGNTYLSNGVSTYCLYNNSITANTPQLYAVPAQMTYTGSCT